MRPAAGEFWTCPRDLPGQTVFVVGGGPSFLTQDAQLLRGCNVIVINSSYEALPWASMLICHDPQWWREHKDKLKAFAGLIIAPSKVSLRCSQRLFMKLQRPPGLSSDPTALTMLRTTFTAAINVAAHRVGAGGTIILLGADGKKDQQGRSHHHQRHHWWKENPKRWGIHHDELATLVEPLRERNIDVINASPGSAWADLWPVMTLEQAIEQTTARRAA